MAVLGNHVHIGSGTTLGGSITIGNNVAIGTNAVVTEDTPDNSIVVGVPQPLFLKWIVKIGESNGL